MDLALILRRLWRRRWLVAVGSLVALAVGLSSGYRISSSGLESKQLSLAVASTQILIDSPISSTLTDLGVPTRQLAEKAGVYPRFMTTLPVRSFIAAEMKVPVDAIITDAPVAGALPQALREPVDLERAEGLLDERKQLYLRFSTDSGLPTVTIRSQAGDVATARRLADAGAKGFMRYVTTVQRRREVPDERRVTIRQLGSAEGGTVGGPAKRSIMLITFVVVLIGWCLLVLVFDNVRRHWAAAGHEEDVAGPARPASQTPARS